MINDTFAWLQAHITFSRPHRVPVQLQTEAAECGLACVAMVAARYGKHIDLLTLRQKAGLSSRGTTLGALITLTESLGLANRALSLEMKDLNDVRIPCILHWNFNHFVVLVSADNDRYVIHDPAAGRRVINSQVMSENFTGVALELWPTAGFVAEKRQSRLKLSTLLHSITGLKNALLKIFCVSLIIEFVSLLMPVGTQMVMDNAVPAADKSLLTLICLSLMILILLQAGVSVFRSWTAMVMSTYIDIQWKEGLFRHMLRLPLPWFEKRRMGDIQSRFVSLDTLRTTFTQSITGALVDTIIAVGALILLILYGGALTWVVLGFTLLFVLLRVATYGRYRQASEELLIKNSRVASSFTETLYAVATIRAQGLAEQRRQNWLSMVAEATNATVSLTRFDMLFRIVSTFIGACDSVIILWLGIAAVIDHTLTLGAFVAFSSFRAMFSDRVLSLTGLLLQMRMLSLHNERIADIALTTPEEEKPAKSLFEPGKALALEVNTIGFCYDNHAPAIFSKLTLRIEAGESVAIAGPSGSGKTTLMKVLCGLAAPEEGQILVDGRDIQAIGVNNYRAAVACILQEDRLLAGSLRDNITGFNREVDEARMEACAKLSHIHDDIMALPMGYETLTGELGEGLSGGQRQRIFIARALYRRPGILFMDEATSHLDEDNEALINAAIRQLNITRVIIAHRPSTIASADRIITLNKQP
ncbi:peptidase domain-containing ABC transporter [Erwinia oleae]|uniref:peptidase domain-containing ABC transporter n=1 Tax=Erwinia oleae TaxID=796334 RepID=UPI00068E5477|nr:peptidase domain-containing ABC transporter [Erwinia oleae]